ncbi:NTP transferase domain-containing protein [Hyphococcus sp. DH-69]|uniref:nucleotidyltransferase family protein n=1 Tax=Hyphococcus formosus TaxID=3143534 RepID=UPI00398BB8D6
MKLEECAILVLASGLSRRFGSANKLLANLSGRPLADHIAQWIETTPIGQKFVVVPHGEEMLAEIFTGRGFTILENSNPDAGQGASLAMGVKAITQTLSPAGIFVALADMPFVQPDTFLRLAATIGNANLAIATDGKRTTPPALFAKTLFPALIALTGDQGAKQILDAHGPIARLPVDPEQLRDIDTPTDLGAGK